MQGEVRLRQGNAREASIAYERALAESPTQTIALLQGLCRALGQAGRYQVRQCLALVIPIDAAT